MQATSVDGVTFGQAISVARRRQGLSQRELAVCVLKEDDGGVIPPQYLHDIEHDRRSPSSVRLIRQFSSALNIPDDYLSALAGRLPDDIELGTVAQESVVRAFVQFRHAVEE